MDFIIECIIVIVVLFVCIFVYFSFYFLMGIVVNNFNKRVEIILVGYMENCVFN